VIRQAEQAKTKMRILDHRDAIHSLDFGTIKLKGAAKGERQREKQKSKRGECAACRMIFANKSAIALALVAVCRGPVRNERSHERKDQAGSCDPDPSTCTPTNERAPFALFCPSSVRVRAAHLPSSRTPSCTITLAIFPTTPASRGGDVIHACDATRIVLPHRHTGVELCRIRSRPRIHLSAITCPLGEEGEEGEEEEEEEADPGL